MRCCCRRRQELQYQDPAAPTNGELANRLDCMIALIITTHEHELNLLATRVSTPADMEKFNEEKAALAMDTKVRIEAVRKDWEAELSLTKERLANLSEFESTL